MIKKITLVFLVAILAIGTANAQIPKGKILLGGSTNLSFTSSTYTDKYDGTKTGDSKTATFELNPQVGYFIMDGLAVGLDLSYSSSKTKSGSGSWSDPTTMIGVGVFGKYYMGTTNIKPFGLAHLGVISTSTSPKDVDKDRGYAMGLALGGAYFINESVAFELSLGYDYAKFKNKADNKSTTDAGVLGLNVGVVVTF